MQITVDTVVAAPLAEVWRAYSAPEDITQWNAASDDWHTPSASVDFRVGGTFTSRMEARDGSMGFDFTGTYVTVEPRRRIVAEFGGRTLEVEFIETGAGVRVRETFDAEDQNPVEMQRQGWQAILDNFARHVTARRG